MKELKYAELTELEAYGVKVKPYLTVAEQVIVLNAMMAQDNYIVARKAMGLSVLELCTDMESVKEEDYDLYVSSGLLENVMHFAYSTILEVEIAYDKEKSVEKLLEDFLNNTTKTINDLAKKMPKGKQLEGIVSQLSTMVNKEDGNK